MTANGWLQFVAFFAVLLLLMRPLGLYIARVLEAEKTFLDPLLRPVERLLYREDFRRAFAGDIGEIIFPPRAMEYYTAALTGSVDIDVDLQSRDRQHGAPPR